jgi:hypothetical protein
MDIIEIQHYIATQAGAAFLPFIAIMFGLSRWAGELVARYGSQVTLTVGPLVAACGIALFAVVPQGRSYCDSSLAGYRAVIWIAAGLAELSAMTAWLVIGCATEI